MKVKWNNWIQGLTQTNRWTKMKGWIQKHEKSWRIVKIAVGICVILCLVVLPYLINQTYVEAVVVTTVTRIAVYIAASFYFIVATILVGRTFYNYRDQLNKKHIILAMTLLSLITLVLTAGTVVESMQMVHPTNHYEKNEDHEPEVDKIYVTYHNQCQYCTVSHLNMLRAVRTYNQTHLKQIQVVNLEEETTLAKKLTSLVDHYGSVVSIDANGTLHEVTYTLSNTGGKPMANRPSDIYKRIQQVEKYD